MTPRDQVYPDAGGNLYTRYHLPMTAQAHAPTRLAIAAYVAYRDDPIFAPKPTDAEVRLVACYCQEYISSPLFTYPAYELAQLRECVVYIRTVADLADWLWDCRRIGIEPL